MNVIVPVEIPNTTVTRVGLSIPDGLPIKEWAEIGKLLCAASEAMAWCIGDWLNYGEKYYGKQKDALQFFGKEVLGNLGYEYATLRTYASVAKSVKLFIRINTLTFSHHQVVSPLEDKEQSFWLNAAKENGWSVAQLRTKLREAKGEYQEEPQRVEFNTLNWAQDGMRYFRKEIAATPLPQWPNDRLALVFKDLNQIVGVYSLLWKEMDRRGLISQKS